MLSDEERELIEEIQKGNKIGIYELIRTFKREGIENFITVRRKYIDIMINLIEKQSKEIEELKEKNSHITKETVEFVNSHYIHKGEIKAKIEELENDPNNLEEHNCLRADTCYVINVLQSLLEKE